MDGYQEGNLRGKRRSVEVHELQFNPLAIGGKIELLKKQPLNSQWERCKAEYLSRLSSPNTCRAYNAAICKLDEWAAVQKTSARLLSKQDAKRYFEYLSSQKLALSSIRRDIAALSAFYAYMQKQGLAGHNPFDRIIPQVEGIRETEITIPTAEEVETILRQVPPFEKAVIICITTRGFSSSSLPTLKKDGGHYQAIYKGKPITDGNTPGLALSERALTAIRDAGLDENQPFAGYSATAIEKRILNHVGKVYQKGLVKAAYSCRDFRNFFAATEFAEKMDIYRLSKQLGHTSLQTTQSFLWRLGFKV